MPAHRSRDTGGDSVGARIRAARVSNKYTQSQLAGNDFSISYISAIERGQIQPSLRALEIIARRLGLPSSYFFQATPLADQEHAVRTIYPSDNHHVDDAEARLEYDILEARVLLKQGQMEQGIAQLEKLRDHSHDARVQLRLNSLLGNAYLRAGKLRECEMSLIEAEKLAIRNNDTHAMLRIHYRLGLAYAAMSQIDRAVKEHEMCLELLEHIQTFDPFLLCALYNQLGMHYTQLNESEKALEMFKEAEALTGKMTSRGYVPAAFQDLSKSMAETNYPHRAMLYAHKSLLEQEWRLDPAFLADLYLDLGRAMARGGDDDAQAILEAALERYSNEPLVRGAILVALAEWQRARQQLEQAEQLAARASECVSSLGDSPVAAETLWILGQLAYDRGKPEEGKTRCAAAIEMLQRLELPQKVSEYAVEFSSLLEQHDESEEALRYMKLAYETQARSGL